MPESRQHFGQGARARYRRAKKNGPQSIGVSRGGRTTKIHLVAADERTALTFRLSPGQASDDTEGRKVLADWEAPPQGLPLAMDRAYEGDAMRQAVRDKGLHPVVPPKANRKEPWEYDRNLYAKRNQVERLFCRLKNFRRVATRYDKLDRMYSAFIHLAFIFDFICVNTP